MLIAPRCEIIHQCGANNVETVKQLLGDKMPADYHLFAFLDNEQMRQALAAADLVIARAGAGTIAEIAAMGKASILIPLPNAAADHQLKNATEFAHLGGTIIMEEMNLTPHLFQNEIFSLLDNPDLMKKMGERAKQFAHPDAAQRLAQEILNLAKR
jgi:UDP-N-acetylglucosamine--N-acetylmuramyl-(pentapeptide) pyrophosphoryl-undecaprenol N-acetylglucosamine transferase